MLFRVRPKVGGHSQAGRYYVAGDIIESDEDLTQKFVNKFDEVHDRDAKVSEGTIELGPGIPTPAQVKGEGKVDDGAKTESSPEPVSPDETPTEPEEPEGEHGKDVTELFPTAGELDMKVFVKDHWYVVVDTEDSKVLNEKKIREKDVQVFLESYADDAEEDDGEEDSK